MKNKVIEKEMTKEEKQKMRKFVDSMSIKQLAEYFKAKRLEKENK
jgi:hypothetical protein